MGSSEMEEGKKQTKKIKLSLCNMSDNIIQYNETTEIIFEQALTSSCKTYLTRYFQLRIIISSGVLALVCSLIGLLLWHLRGTLFFAIIPAVTIAGFILSPFCGDREFVLGTHPTIVRFNNEFIQCVSSTREWCLELRLVRKVIDHGAFYTIHSTPLKGIVLCKKDSITHGDIDKYEALWGERLQRKVTALYSINSQDYCDVQRVYYKPLVSATFGVLALFVFVFGWIIQTKINITAFIVLQVSCAALAIVGLFVAVAMIARKCIFTGENLIVSKWGRRTVYPRESLSYIAENNCMKVLNLNTRRHIITLHRKDYDVQKLMSLLSQHD